jgi:hypothetical protein
MTPGQSKPESTEQRRESRQRRTSSFTGEILLRDGRTRVDSPVVALRDCSASGASVLTRQAYEPGHLVSLVVSSDGIAMEHVGTVAWCKPASEDELDERRMPRGSLLFTIGLQMRGPVSLAATLMARPSPRPR